MKNAFAVAIGLAVFSMGCDKAGSPAETNQANGTVQRIGVYDSRAIAVAFTGSPAHNEAMKHLIAERDKARAAGDQRRVAELEAQGRAGQELRHEQGFSTAPVDDILEQVKDKVEIVKSNAHVGVLVSKWDMKALANYSRAEQVDVTEQLVKALNPNPKALKWALDIQKQKPIPPEELKKH